MKTKDFTYLGKVLHDGHLSLDEDIKRSLMLEEGDELLITIKKPEDVSNIVSDIKLSNQAQDYIDYLIGSGLKAKYLKRIIKAISAIDDKYLKMPRSEFIKEAYAIAAKRASTWSQKHHLDPTQLSDDELLETINKHRDRDSSEFGKSL